MENSEEKVLVLELKDSELQRFDAVSICGSILFGFQCAIY
jgi:hypothetical protein